MIITCEKCNARYLLASLLLGVAGRKVRCGVCGHTWFQEPVDEEPVPRDDDPAEAEQEPSDFRSFLEQESDQSIPDSVRPIPDGSALPALANEQLPGKSNAVSRGVFSALLCAAVILMGMVMMRGAIVAMWPPAILAYSAIGLAPSVPGEGLIFDHVSAKAVKGADGVETLQVTGNIINLKRRGTPLPKVRASVRKSQDDEGQVWTITVDKSFIGGEESIPFSSSIQGIESDMKEVNIRFVLK